MSGAPIPFRNGCEAYRELISAELDGALAADEIRDLAQHLARCGPCAEVRADYAAIGAALAPGANGPMPGNATWAAIDRYVSGNRSAPAAAVAASGVASVLARSTTRDAAAGRGSWRRIGLRAAAALLAAGAAFYAGRMSAPPEAVPAPHPIPAPQAASPSRETEEAALALILNELFAGGSGAPDLNARVREVVKPRPSSIEESGRRPERY